MHPFLTQGPQGGASLSFCQNVICKGQPRLMLIAAVVTTQGSETLFHIQLVRDQGARRPRPLLPAPTLVFFMGGRGSMLRDGFIHKPRLPSHSPLTFKFWLVWAAHLCSFYGGFPFVGYAQIFFFFFKGVALLNILVLTFEGVSAFNKVVSFFLARLFCWERSE